MQYQPLAEPFVIVVAEDVTEKTANLTQQGIVVRRPPRVVQSDSFVRAVFVPEHDMPTASLPVTRITFSRRRQYVALTAPIFVPSAAPALTVAEMAIAAIPIVPQWIARKYAIRVEPRQFTATPRLPEMTTWYRPASEPVRRKPVTQWAPDLSIAPPLLPLVQPVLLSQWYQPLSEPVRVKQRWTYTLPWLAEQDVAQPLPRQESWDVYRQDPIRRVRQHNYIGPFDYRTEVELPPPVIPGMDTWFQPTPAFVWGRPNTYLTGPTFTWYSETGPDVEEAVVLGKLIRVVEVWLETILT